MHNFLIVYTVFSYTSGSRKHGRENYVISDKCFQTTVNRELSNMTSRLPLLDSQDTVEDESACRELSQDLFGGASGDNACRHVLVPEKFMTDILQELRSLKKMVQQLGEASANDASTLKKEFKVEEQVFHKTYYQYLKGSFCVCPWVNTESADFKREVRRLIGDNCPQKFKVMASFATSKFTQLRNQFRRMLFHSTLDIQGLSLEGLCNFLYKTFTPPGESSIDKRKQRMTVIFRAFLSSKKFQECDKFWIEFKDFYDSVQADQRPNIIELLAEKEEKRIRRYREEHDKET
uniref:Uncharacterized protein LOC111113364 n=1 Tax=Crassostrea virginica TaxID=6565 RepID=A0A8B8BVB6_CRAVI|nr:uncharacterized protein LOC111113364 [Crassostrea virginica]